MRFFYRRRLEIPAGEPPVGGHIGLRMNKLLGVLEVLDVPGVGVLPPDPGEVRTRPFRSPEEGPVIGELAGLGVLPVAHDLRSQGPHRLGVAVVAPFLHVDVLPRQLEGPCRA